MIHQTGWGYLDGWSLGKVNFLIYLDWTMSILSMLGSIILFIVCIRLPSKTISVKFIIALALADAFYSGANIMSNFLHMRMSEAVLCHIQGLTRYCSFILSIYFSACTAIVSYQPAAFLNRTNPNRFVACIASVGLLIFIGIPLFCVNFFERITIDVEVLDCGFKLQNEPSVMKILIFYCCLHSFPIIMALFIVIKGYLKALKSANEIPKAIMDQLGFKKHDLLLYPIILLMAFLPDLVSDITSIFSHPPPFWMLVIEISISHSIGIINAILYIKLRKLYQIGSPDRISEVTAELIGTNQEIDSVHSIYSSGIFHRRKTSRNGSLLIY